MIRLTRETPTQYLARIRPAHPLRWPEVRFSAAREKLLRRERDQIEFHRERIVRFGIPAVGRGWTAERAAEALEALDHELGEIKRLRSMMNRIRRTP